MKEDVTVDWNDAKPQPIGIRLALLTNKRLTHSAVELVARIDALGDAIATAAQLEANAIAAAELVGWTETLSFVTKPTINTNK